MRKTTFSPEVELCPILERVHIIINTKRGNFVRSYKRIFKYMYLLKNMKTDDVVRVLSEIILYEMGKEDLTSREMAKRCGVSKRKLDEIIYQEDKGLTVDILLKVCKGVGIELNLNYDFEKVK